MAQKVDLDSYNNGSYYPGASTPKRVIWYIINILFFINPIITISAIKVWMLRIFGARIGIGVVIKPNVNIKYPWHLVIGDHVWIGENVWIDNLAPTNIGSNVCISQGAMLLSGNHNYESESFDLIVGKITLMDGAWVGAKSVVCPGVTLHSHAILTVGSVATKDLQAFGIYQGNPAIFKKQRQIS